MELAQTLSHIPIEKLSALAVRWGIRTSQHSKHLLVQDIAAFFRNPRKLREAAESLNEVQLQVLRCCLLLPPGTASLDDLIQVLHLPEGQAHHVNLEEITRELMELGFLYPEGRFIETGLFTFPSDLKRSLRGFLLSTEDAEEAVPQAPPGEVLSRPTEFLDDLFGLGCITFKETLRITGDGSLFKRSMERVIRRLRVPVDFGLQGALVEIRGLPTRFEALLEAAVSLRLIRRTDGEYHVGPDWEKWLVKSRQEMTGEVFRHLEGSVIKKDFQLRNLLQHLLALAAPDEWVAVEWVLRQKMGIASDDSPLGTGTRRRALWLLQFLMNLGLCEIGRVERQDLVVFRPTEMGMRIFEGEPEPTDSTSPEISITIQPNFEILIGREVPYRTRWNIERIAELTSQDVIATYSVTKESLYRGLCSGIAWETIEKEILSHLSRPCPGNVEHNLRGWSERFGEIQFVDGLLLRCRTPMLATEISHLPEVRPVLKGAVSEQDLLVDRKHYEEVIEALTRHGYMPEPRK